MQEETLNFLANSAIRELARFLETNNAILFDENLLTLDKISENKGTIARIETIIQTIAYDSAQTIERRNEEHV